MNAAHFVLLSVTQYIFFSKEEVVNVTTVVYWIIRPLLLEYYEAEVKMVFIFFMESILWNAAARTSKCKFSYPAKAAPCFLNTVKIQSKVFCVTQNKAARQKHLTLNFFCFCVSNWPEWIQHLTFCCQWRTLFSFQKGSLPCDDVGCVGVIPPPLLEIL